MSRPVPRGLLAATSLAAIAVSGDNKPPRAPAKVSIPTTWTRKGLVIPRTSEHEGVAGDPCIVWDPDIHGWRMVMFYSPPGHAQDDVELGYRLRKAAWGKEVDKMVKWGAILDSADRDSLIEYLGTSFPVDKPPYAAQRSARKH